MAHASGYAVDEVTVLEYLRDTDEGARLAAYAYLRKVWLTAGGGRDSAASGATLRELAKSICEILKKSDEKGPRRAACAGLLCLREAAAPHQQQIFELLSDTDTSVRWGAMSIVEALCDRKLADAIDLEDRLMRVVDRQDAQQADAIRILTKLGVEPQSSDIGRWLRSEQLEVRQQALRAIAAQPMCAVGHEALVVERLREPMLRVEALKTVARLGGSATPLPDEVASDISTFLEDSSEDIRQAAAEALGSLANQCGPTVVQHIVTQALMSFDPPVCAAACRALGRLGEVHAGQHAEILASIIYHEEEQPLDFLSDQKASLLVMEHPGDTPGPVRLKDWVYQKPPCAAADALAKLGTVGQEYDTEIANRLYNAYTGQDVKIACMLALRDMPVKGLKHIDKVSACLVEGSANWNELLDLHCAALGVLAEMCRTIFAHPAGESGQADPYLQRILQCLGNPEPNAQIAAVRAIGVVGPAAGKEARRLVPLLRGTSEEIVLTVLKSLELLGVHAVSYYNPQDVISLLSSGRKAVRLATVRTIAVMQVRDSAEPVADLVDRDPSVDVREAAARTLGQLGLFGARCADSLVRLLDSPHSQLRLAGCQALSTLARDGRDLPQAAAKLLREAAETDVFVEVRKAARMAKSLIGKAPDSP